MKRRQTSAAKVIAAGMLPIVALKRRGWTPFLISKLLGEPDRADLQCYALDRVEDAESGPAFQKHVAKFSAKQIEREFEAMEKLWAKLSAAARAEFLKRKGGAGC